MPNIYLVPNKKPAGTGNLAGLQICEISMKQNPIQSNLPEFDASSMTSERLYQHPEPKSVAKEVASNVAAWSLVLSILVGLSAMFIHQADKESERQVEAISTSVGGAK